MHYDPIFNIVLRDDADAVRDSDDFDERGLLRDGKKLKVSMTFMDSIQQAASSVGVTLVDRQELQDWQKAELSARWKGGLREGDPVRLGDRNLVVAGRNPDNGVVQLQDTATLDSERLRAEAYDAYEAALTSAYKRDEDFAEGDVCFHEGYAGHIVRTKSGALVCAPDKVRKPSSAKSAVEPKQKEPDDDEWMMAGPLSDAERMKVKDAAYEEHRLYLENAWKASK